MSYQRYVALGDSFTEGVGDLDDSRPHGVRGWADRVAEVLAAGNPAFEYANLAIRGRKLARIVAEQVGPAVAMRPDLVTVYAGANDILRPRVDIDALAATYDQAVARLAGTGARVCLFTAWDPGRTPVFGATRGRYAIYTEWVREIAERHGATVVDMWRMRTAPAWAMWAEDRLHLNEVGHSYIARLVLDTLEVSHDLPLPGLPEQRVLTSREARSANLAWARRHAAPWLHRRITGRSSGDGLAPRRPTPAPVD